MPTKASPSASTTAGSLATPPLTTCARHASMPPPPLRPPPFPGPAPADPPLRSGRRTQLIERKSKGPPRRLWLRRRRRRRAPAKKVNRCLSCRKRVGFTGFRCRCGELFCGEHRYSDRHDCGYDYKAAARAAIARANPIVRAAKIVRV
ncbi:unnamed protein product [Musa banksii]